MSPQKLILLLDDDPSWQDLYQEVLQDEGYAVQVAATKLQAFQKLEEFVFDIAIVDLRLDDKNPKNVEGLDVAARIKEKGAATHVIVKSGFLTKEIEQRLARLGVDGILEKNGNRRELLDLIARLVSP